MCGVNSNQLVNREFWLTQNNRQEEHLKEVELDVWVVHGQHHVAIFVLGFVHVYYFELVLLHLLFVLIFSIRCWTHKL